MRDARAHLGPSDRLNAGAESRNNPAASPHRRSRRAAPSATARHGFDRDPIATTSPDDSDTRVPPSLDRVSGRGIECVSTSQASHERRCRAVLLQTRPSEPGTYDCRTCGNKTAFLVRLAPDRRCRSRSRPRESDSPWHLRRRSWAAGCRQTLGASMKRPEAANAGYASDWISRGISDRTADLCLIDRSRPILLKNSFSLRRRFSDQCACHGQSVATNTPDETRATVAEHPHKPLPGRALRSTSPPAPPDF
jgi:hypothetical protein